LLFNRIYKTASYITRDLEEAKDIAQSACVEVLLSAGTYRGDSSVSYWADRVTLQTASKILHKKKRRERILSSFYQPPMFSKGSHERAEASEIRDRLAVHMQTLKLNLREIVLLRYVYDYTIKEAAEICGIPLETARGRLKTGRFKLKKRIMNDPILSDWVKEWIEE